MMVTISIDRIAKYKLTFVVLAIVVLLVCAISFGIEPPLQVTTSESDYIQRSNVKWVMESNAAPYVYSSNGVISGISVDYLELISKKTGIVFIPVLGGTLVESLSKLRSSEVNMITSIRPTPARAEYSYFSRPYLYVDCVMMQRTGDSHTVGIGRGFAVKTYLQVERKNLKIVEFDDDEVSFTAFMDQKVDSIVLDELTARYLIKKYKMQFKMIKVPYEYPISFAVTKNDLILLAILDKAITNVTDDERRRILEKWTF